MEVMFTIPTLISPECPYKLVPALCKLIERNTLITYSSVIRQAAIIKFAGPNKGLLDSDALIHNMKRLVSLVEADDDEGSSGRYDRDPRRNDVRYPNPGGFGGASAEVEKWTGRPEQIDRDKIETPRGISFYATISLEPTFLDIPLEGRPTPDSIDRVTRVVRVGMKCVPLRLDGVTDLLDALSIASNRTKLKTMIAKKMERVHKLLGRKYRTQKEIIHQVMHTVPSNKELANPKYLVNLFHGGSTPVDWSFLTIFTAQDFEERQLKDLLIRYRSLVNGGWGDMIVIDDIKEVISFCTQRTLSCTQMHLDYLRDILNLTNIIDADLFKKTSSSGPLFSAKRVPITKVFESACLPCLEKNSRKKNLHERLI